MDEVDSRPPVTQHSIDINCVQDFPSLNSSGPGSGGESVGGGGTKSMATHLAQQNRFTIRARGGANILEEEFPSLGSTSVTVSTAQATTQSPTSPTTSVHLKVNTKKAPRDAQGASSRSSNVSIQYNRTVPAATNGAKAPTTEEESRVTGAQIGVISHSSNITLQSTANGKKNSKTPDEDFPALSVSSKAINAGLGSAGWGTSVTPPPTSVPTKVSKTLMNDFPSLGPSLGAPSLAPSKPGKKFNASDFPTLAPNVDSQTHMRNYHGRSSVTIPVSNAWTHTVDQVPKPSEAGENSGGPKGKKKKKGTNKTNSSESISSSGNSSQGSLPNGTLKAKSGTKKKPLGLHNIFDDSDDDGVKTDLSMGKLGEYESVAPVASSNLKMITSDIVSDVKKSELKIGTLKAPPPKMDSDEAFPSLAPATAPSLLATSTWSSPAKKSAPPGFSSKPKVPPGFNATDMTFTSSSGEKFSISSTSDTALTARPTTTYSFNLPPEFELRNKRLIKTIQDECQGDEDKFTRFKQLAGQFRSEELSGHAYYEQCRDVMGKATFHKILPELLVLLPDIKKQQVCSFVFL